MNQTNLKLENEMSLEDLKAFLGRLKKDLKSVQKGKMRSVFLNEILDLESAYLNEIEHAKNFKEKYLQEKIKSRWFLWSPLEAEAAGWNYAGGKKAILAENFKKQEKWADKAYPSFNADLWEVEHDILNCVAILKSL